MSISRAWRARAVVCALLSLAASPSDPDTTAETGELAAVERSVVTREGLRFNVPTDWPIEQRGAAVGPIAVEDYVVRKFTAVEQRLQQQDERIKQLEERLHQLEQSLPAGKVRLRSEPASAGPSEAITPAP